MQDSILSNDLEIQYDVDSGCLCLWHPNLRAKRVRLVEIRKATLGEMSFSEASQFVGERILLLMPAMREQFKDYLWTDDGATPPKKT
jgi:hypothetical protein